MNSIQAFVCMIADRSVCMHVNPTEIRIYGMHVLAPHPAGKNPSCPFRQVANQNSCEEN